LLSIAKLAAVIDDWPFPERKSHVAMILIC